MNFNDLTTRYILLVAVIFAIPAVVLSWFSAENTTISIIDKDRMAVFDGTRSFSYTVFAENEVFVLYDSLLFFHFDTLDVYNRIIPGSTCDVRVAGYRIPILSSTRNILEVYRCF